MSIIINRGFPGGSDGKASAYNAEDPGLIPESGISPGERNGYPFQYSCLEHSVGQRSLVGYSPWGYKELEMTERLTHKSDNIIQELFNSGLADPLDDGVATDSSMLPWRIPWTEEPGGLWSTGLQRVIHN